MSPEELASRIGEEFSRTAQWPSYLLYDRELRDRAGVEAVLASDEEQLFAVRWSDRGDVLTLKGANAYHRFAPTGAVDLDRLGRVAGVFFAREALPFGPEGRDGRGSVSMREIVPASHDPAILLDDGQDQLHETDLPPPADGRQLLRERILRRDVAPPEHGSSEFAGLQFFRRDLHGQDPFLGGEVRYLGPDPGFGPWCQVRGTPSRGRARAHDGNPARKAST